MKVSTKQAQRLCEALDERYQIALATDERMGNKDGWEFLPSNPDFIFYKGMRDALEQLGFTIRRNGKDKHTVYHINEV